jgi:DUF4097 and DUF4098 domain-containing protein YvlB
MVDADGVLHIKYRKSAWFFGFGEKDREKKLTLRVPKHFFDDLQQIDVEAGSATVVIRDIAAQAIEVEGSSGMVDLALLNCPQSLEVSTKSGNVTLRLPDTADFYLEWESKSGTLSHDLAMRQSGSGYLCGGGKSQFDVETISGDLTVTLLK